MARVMNHAPPMRVLLVDDDDSLRALICELLVEIGYELVCIAAVDEVADNASFLVERGDLILIDVGSDRAEAERARLAAAFPQATVIAVGDGEYESIPRAGGRDRKRRARATQARHASERSALGH